MCEQPTEQPAEHVHEQCVRSIEACLTLQFVHSDHDRGSSQPPCTFGGASIMAITTGPTLIKWRINGSQI